PSVGNDEIIQAAVQEIQLRSPLDPPTVSKPETWRQIGIELLYYSYKVRLRPVGDDTTRVEVFDDRGNPRTGPEIVGGYLEDFDQGDDLGPAKKLADEVEGVYRRAIS